MAARDGDDAGAAVLIRDFEADDIRELRLLVGMSVIERLPLANRRAYFHPLVWGSWLVLASLFVHFMDWWPKSDRGFLGYLYPLPGFAAVAAPVMFLIDWIQRPYFEKMLRQVISTEDLMNIDAYYNKNTSPFSRFVVLVWKQRPIGYLALDAATPDDELVNLEDSGDLDAKEVADKGFDAATGSSSARETKQALSSRKSKAAAARERPSYAVIRRFHVDRVYHRAGIQDDLIASILDRTFADSKAAAKQEITKILVRVTSLEPEARKILEDNGFTVDAERKGGKVAGSKVFVGESFVWLSISKSQWQARKA